MKPIVIDNERVEPGAYLGLVLRALPVFVLVGLGCSMAGGLLVASVGLVGAAAAVALLLGAGIAAFILVLVLNAVVMDWQLVSIKVDESQKDSAIRRRVAGKVEIGAAPAIVSFNSTVTNPTITNDGRTVELNGLPASFVSRLLEVIEERGTMARSQIVGLEIEGRAVRQSDYARLVELFNDRRWLARGKQNTYELVETPRNIRAALGLPLSGKVIKGEIVNRTKPN